MKKCVLNLLICYKKQEIFIFNNFLYLAETGYLCIVSAKYNKKYEKHTCWARKRKGDFIKSLAVGRV